MKNLFLHLHILALNLYAGSYAPLLEIFTNFINETRVFLQTISVGIITCMSIYYKIREATANVQEDQAFSQKTQKVLVCLVFIFLIPTIISVLQSFFK